MLLLYPCIPNGKFHIIKEPWQDLQDALLANMEETTYWHLHVCEDVGNTTRFALWSLLCKNELHLRIHTYDQPLLFYCRCMIIYRDIRFFRLKWIHCPLCCVVSTEYSCVYFWYTHAWWHSFCFSAGESLPTATYTERDPQGIDLHWMSQLQFWWTRMRKNRTAVGKGGFSIIDVLHDHV